MDGETRRDHIWRGRPWRRRAAIGLGAIGLGFLVYAPIAIFGPVWDIEPPAGPLDCSGSALSLRHDETIERNPEGHDCRTQAEDQVSGAYAALAVGPAFLVGCAAFEVWHRRRDRST